MTQKTLVKRSIGVSLLVTLLMTLGMFSFNAGVLMQVSIVLFGGLSLIALIIFIVWLLVS